MRSRRAAFTLVELLVALALASVILGGVYAAFDTTSRSIQQVRGRGELIQTARVIINELRRDLGSIYPLRIPVDEEEAASLGLDEELPPEGVVSFAGENGESDDGSPADNLRFTTALKQTARGVTAFDVVERMYLLDLDTETEEEGLVRRTNYYPGLSVAEDVGIEVVELSRLCSHFEVLYLSPDAMDAEADLSDDEMWLEEWSDPDQLPLAVMVQIGLTPKNGDPEVDERLFRAVITLPIRQPRPNLQPQGDQAPGAGTAGADDERNEPGAPDEDDELNPSLPGALGDDDELTELLGGAGRR